MKHNYTSLKMALLMALCFAGFTAKAQNDVMMQAFYWDVPVDNVNLNGTWWDNLKSKAAAMDDAGFTGIWIPSASKGNFGIWDMGYGIYDHYDMGNYNQKGTTETRFGSRAELESMITEMHNEGIDVYMDIILNHIYTNSEDDESNPAVKQYVFDEAFRNGTQYQSYPTNEIKWVIPNAAPGDYYIQIGGYLLDYGAVKGERAYEVYIDYGSSGSSGTVYWESEPNNGSGNTDDFPGSGEGIRGHIEYSGDIDEYKVSVTSTTDIEIYINARREGTDSQGAWEWQWGNQNNGYYPKAVWYNGSNLANSTLEAHTNTGISYPTHTGTGEANYTWDYTHFHPVDGNDWLGYPGSDEIITNTKFFGNDLNTFSPTVQTRMNDWGEWLVNELDFDGFRMDFVRGFQTGYIADWVDNLPLKNGAQRFIVGEYWGPSYRIRDWVNDIGGQGVDVDGFDFDLKFTLTQMANGNQSSYDMRWLNNAGLVRGGFLGGTSAVTFVENHDTGKEHDKWVFQDWKMPYAYILTHEGRPCVFYSHYYGTLQEDAHGGSYTTQAPASLQDDINFLMFARRTYIGGGLEVLSDAGNPYPSGDAYHVYAARRGGNGTKDGAIIVINNHDSQTKGLWVDAGVNGQSSWANTTLKNAE
ncbi:MAG TPA: alpha-amylase, partial [Cytophagales bacterium]|nr:alpha-amylase [Cytophagales bacterium]